MRNWAGLNSSSRHLSFKRCVGVLLALLLLVGGSGKSLVLAQGESGLRIANITRATVFVMSVYDIAGGRAISCVGSGTMVSSGGLILTNAHNVVDSETCQVDDIAISLTLRQGDAPVLTYYADLVIYDLSLDLAVLQIARQLDGRDLDQSTLSLPFVELGDSSQLQLDDTIAVFGYPGLGNDPVSIERGTTVGFLAEANVGERAWIKTQASIEGTMSGGGAYNEDGQLIGIPTTAPASAGETALDCRRIQDTNGDALVDSRDNCVPIGGFIDGLRPLALARRLVRAAQLGIRDRGHMFSSQVASSGSDLSGEPAFSNLFLSPSVNQAGLPTTLITQMPAGANSLFLFFDYENMRPGMVYELQTTKEGILESRFSLSPVLWSGGENGLWYIGSTGQPWPNGVYEFTLRIEGERVASTQLTIGGAPLALPSFSDIVLGVPDFQGNVMGGGYVLPEGDTINVQFIHRNMGSGTLWSQRWYYQGEAIQETSTTLTWALEPDGAASFPFAGNPRILPGRYRLELFIEDRLATLTDFVVAGARDGAFARIYENPRFATQIADGAPGGTTGESFANPVTDLYAFVDWRFLAAGTPWTYRWLVDEDVLFERTEIWAGPETGTNFWLHLGSDLQLPDGAYGLQLLVGGELFAEQTVEVGLGQLPVAQGNEATGVLIAGQAVDAQTGEGISGALFILLKAEFSVEDFIWDESQVFGMSLTDRQGRFEVSRLLPRDDFYSMVILASGYLPVTADGIFLAPDADSQLELLVELNKD